MKRYLLLLSFLSACGLTPPTGVENWEGAYKSASKMGAAIQIDESHRVIIQRISDSYALEIVTRIVTEENGECKMAEITLVPDTSSGAYFSDAGVTHYTEKFEARKEWITSTLCNAFPKFDKVLNRAETAKKLAQGFDSLDETWGADEIPASYRAGSDSAYVHLKENYHIVFSLTTGAFEGLILTPDTSDEPRVTQLTANDPSINHAGLQLKSLLAKYDQGQATTLATASNEEQDNVRESRRAFIRKTLLDLGITPSAKP